MAQSVIQVPAGQIVRIYQNDTFSITGIIDSNVQISVSSEFGPMLGRGGESQGSIGKIFDFVVTSAAKLVGAGDEAGNAGFSTVFPQLTARVWERTDPMKINFTLTYIQGLWGMSGPQIVSEIKKILGLSLPTLNGNGPLIPPGPTIATLYSSPDDNNEHDQQEKVKAIVNFWGPEAAQKVREKMAAKAAFDKAQGTTYEGSPQDLANGVKAYKYQRGRMLKLRIGNYWELDNILVDASNPEFSDICDASGYPVWGKIDVSVSSLMAATTNMLGLKL